MRIDRGKEGLTTSSAMMLLGYTKEAVVQIARKFHQKVMTLLLDRRRGEIKITKGVVEAARWNSRSGREVMIFLLKQRGKEVNITEEVVIGIAEDLDQE